MDCSKQVVLMRGIPGSGKSTLAHKLCDEQLSHWPSKRRYFGICSADRYFYDHLGRYHFNRTQLTRNHRRNLLRFRWLLRHQWPLVICDNTNIYPWMLDEYIAAARRADYAVSVYELAADIKGSQLRAVGKRNQHQVRWPVIREMAANFKPITPKQRQLVDHYFTMDSVSKSITLIE